MRKWIVLALLILTAGCKSTPPKIEAHTSELATRDLEKGMKAIDEQRYDDAIKIFDQILVQHPATEFDLVVLYNSAAAYEGMGKCKEANDRYRRVVRSSTGKYQIIEGQALFRVSLTYECLNQDPKTITSLLDAVKRGVTLPPEITKAEIPARLASAYARLGNRTKALEYFAIASRGLKSLASNRSVRKDLLGQTMYLMGQLSLNQRRASMDPVAYSQSIYIQQPYLLQAMEVGHQIWSKRAADDLLLAYENVWKIPLTNENRGDFYIRTMQNIFALKRLKLPNTSDLVEETYAKLTKIESHLQTELAKTSESTKLTEEALQRESLRREGKVIGSPTVLEGNDTKLPKKKR